MTEYYGYRNRRGEAVVRRVPFGNRAMELPMRLDLDNHSPTGFEWGYGGSGPAQLALAILADTLRDDHRALRLHQKFKWKVIGGLDHESWRLTTSDVLAAIKEIEQEAAA